MTPTEIEAALREAFGECEAVGYPLEAVQKQILLRSLIAWIESQQQTLSGQIHLEQSDAGPSSPEAVPAIAPFEANSANPLEDLTAEQRQVLLGFIQTQAQENRSWKAQLLNDWLHNRDSGELQFIRQRYGLQWLEQIQPSHIAQYADELPLQVGDRIEVANRLWEWVQSEAPCSQEWFLCTVISVTPSSKLGSDLSAPAPTNCTVQFANGMAYEIQGVYEWNRYNWRRVKERSREI
ncbi:MAG: hypothetical protein HC772_04695 [Leptolyngbyaceae cyanobacterium CRU_2_3]|nr:hypothetical protein [Leptolyngbyaceae cyanobacterium CRU_2_3]